MKLDLSSRLACACCAFLLCENVNAWAGGQAAISTIDLLPTLGGSDFSPSALNQTGQLTGYSYLEGDQVAHAFFESEGRITDLGTLGGCFSVGYGINAAGQVAGYSSMSGETEIRAFLYQSGGLLDLGTLGGSYSSASALNDAGQVVGSSSTAGDATMNAFIYENGSMSNLGDLGGGYSSATAINRQGSIIGDSYTLDYAYHGFLYTQGTMVDLGSLGGDYSSAFALNDSDMAVGESSLTSGEVHGFVYAGGVMTDVGTFGGECSSARAINNAGQVIGVAQTANGQDHGFLYAGGTLKDLGTLGGESTAPAALNNVGQVVGHSATPTGSTHAFLWQNGTMVDLNSLLATNSGWELVSAQLINDAGQIVGYGVYNGASRWFILTPGSAANRPPVAVAGPDQTVSYPSQVTLNGSGSTDPDGDVLAFEWSLSGSVLGTQALLTTSLPLGTNLVTLTVSDPSGASAQTNLVVCVVDTTPPVIQSAAAQPNIVKANHKMVPVTVAVAAADDCDPALVSRILSITCSETTAPGDIQITGPLTASLAATFNPPPKGKKLTKPAGNGRVYTITVQCADRSGNVSTATTTVTVVTS